VVSSTPRPHFTPGKDPVPILQEAGWTPGPVWTGGKSRPHRDSIPDRPGRSSVAIPTELPGPFIIIIIIIIIIIAFYSYLSICLCFIYNRTGRTVRVLLPCCLTLQCTCCLALGPPNVLYSGYRGLAITPSPLGQAPWLKKEYSYTSTLPVGLRGLF